MNNNEDIETRPQPLASIKYEAVHRFLYKYAKAHNVTLDIKGDCDNEYIMDLLVRAMVNRGPFGLSPLETTIDPDTNMPVGWKPGGCAR